MIYIHKGDDTDFNDNSFLTFNIVTEKDLTGWQAKFILNGLEKTFEDITSKSFELHYSDEETSQFKLGKTTNELRLVDEEGKIKTVAKNIEIYITSDVIENESQLINLPILKDEGIDINISLASNSGGGGTANHFELLYRDMADQHPIKAITNLQETLDKKVNKNELSNLATKDEIPTKTSQLNNDSSFATESFVTQEIGKIPSVDLTDYATEKYVDDAIDGIDIPNGVIAQAEAPEDKKLLWVDTDDETEEVEDCASREYVDNAIENIKIPSVADIIEALPKYNGGVS